MTETIRVYYYDHPYCEYISKYCDEHHRKSASVPVDVLRQYEVR